MSRGPDAASRAYREVTAMPPLANLKSAVFPPDEQLCRRVKILTFRCADAGGKCVGKPANLPMCAQLFLPIFGRSQTAGRARASPESLFRHRRTVCAELASHRRLRALCRRAKRVASWGGESTLSEGQRATGDRARPIGSTHSPRTGAPGGAHPSTRCAQLCRVCGRIGVRVTPITHCRRVRDGERAAVPFGAGRRAIGS